MTQPLISIIIPVYNGSNFLREAIDSALDQTYENCEIVVINDGSNDNGATEDIARSYGEKIRYYKKENGGVATALNMGIREMKGEYFSWLSHDDMYHPDKIKHEWNAINRCGDRERIAFCDYEVLNVETGRKSIISIGKEYSKERITNGVFPVLQGVLHGCALLIHKSHFEQIGLFDETLISTQDYDLWFRMLRKQTTIYLEEPLVIGRIHREQGSRTISTHGAEQSQLHINFMNTLEEDEMCSLYTSRYMFFYEMMNFYERNAIMGAYDYAYHLFMKEDIPEEASGKIKQLKEHLREYSNGKAEKLCIFCAGDYGMNLYQDLNYRLIRPDYFSDNNPNKWGYTLEGLYCIPPVELDKENTLLIVSIKNPEAVVNQLKEKGFLYVTTKREVDHLMEEVPPIKWLVDAKKLEKVDYSAEDVTQLVDKFNQTLFEVCQYYEKGE
ncbi:MAG: glycosyltransferase family 2 protein [Mobilitalea sp.]